MTAIITLILPGDDTGPFDLKSNVDGYSASFESGVSKSSLVSGYTSASVPDGSTIIRVQSTGVCTSYIDFSIIGI